MNQIKVRRCRKGHFLTPENTTGGKRSRCRTCHNELAKTSFHNRKVLNPEIVFLENKDKIKNIFLENTDKSSSCWSFKKNKMKKKNGTVEPTQHLTIDRVEYNILNVSHFIHTNDPYSKIFCYNVCDTLNCVNPAHIMCSDSWLIRRVKTHCNKGHELTDENSLYYQSGDNKTYKRCRICKNEYKKEQRLKQKEVSNATN